MHNVIVRFLACFIANKQKRRIFRKKYLHISYQKLINTVSDMQKSLENIVSDIQEKIKNIEDKLYKEPENLLINDGKNNSIVFFDENGIETPINTPVKGVDIIIHGNNNVLRLGRKIIAQDSVIRIENDNAFVEINDTNGFFRAYIRVCYGVGQRLCWGKGTTCWGAGGSKITKNAHIHTGCIVAANAVATKDYLESNVCIAGNPAKIVKRGITWDRKNTYYKEIEEKQKNNKVK